MEKIVRDVNMAVAKTSHGINVVVAQTSFLVTGGTYAVF
jgi:hypothetical protein